VRLERAVGACLFVRMPSGVELTEAGTLLLDRAYRIVQLTEHAIDRARLADVGQAGSLVVGYFGSPMFDAVPRLLRGFPEALRPGFADVVSQLCVQAGFSAHVAREAEDVVTALGYVATSGFCSVVPRSATRIALPGVGFVPLADAPPERLSCLYRAGNVAPLVKAFLDHVPATSPEVGGDSH
jgi:DNA-binding transcriptional LysR family regulator